MNNYQTTPDFYNDYIYHYGIKGMRWGIRRYQNEDGTYTKRGLKRYALNRDINDKSRKNIAKIRTGEAKRRLDIAKNNNSTNYTRIAELTGRLRAAKRNERNINKVDRGTKLAAKGQTIGKNNLKSLVAWMAASAGSKGVTKFLNSRMHALSAVGRWSPQHRQVAEMINQVAGLGLYALAGAYTIKKNHDNSALRSYYSAKYQGKDTIKSVGSQEYADRVSSFSKNKKRRTNK